MDYFIWWWSGGIPYNPIGRIIKIFWFFVFFIVDCLGTDFARSFKSLLIFLGLSSLSEVMMSSFFVDFLGFGFSSSDVN